VVVSVSITLLRIRDVLDANCRAQLDGLEDLRARERVLEARIDRIALRNRELDRLGSGWPRVAGGASGGGYRAKWRRSGCCSRAASSRSIPGGSCTSR
jgi:hypothetical protein